ncbi:MAG: helix-turn-helix domain-containing protein [Candidatus Komeilibacteria bacterium]
MKDKYIKFKDFKEELNTSTKGKAAYNIARAKYEIISSILEARQKKGYTQSELAKRIGTKQSAIARIESGKYNPSLDLLVKIAGALDKTFTASLK